MVFEEDHSGDWRLLDQLAAGLSLPDGPWVISPRIWRSPLDSLSASEAGILAEHGFSLLKPERGAKSQWVVGADLTRLQAEQGLRSESRPRALAGVLPVEPGFWSVFESRCSLIIRVSAHEVYTFGKPAVEHDQDAWVWGLVDLLAARTSSVPNGVISVGANRDLANQIADHLKLPCEQREIELTRELKRNSLLQKSSLRESLGREIFAFGSLRKPALRWAVVLIAFGAAFGALNLAERRLAGESELISQDEIKPAVAPVWVKLQALAEILEKQNFGQLQRLELEQMSDGGLGVTFQFASTVAVLGQTSSPTVSSLAQAISRVPGFSILDDSQPDRGRVVLRLATQGALSERSMPKVNAAQALDLARRHGLSIVSEGSAVDWRLVGTEQVASRAIQFVSEFIATNSQWRSIHFVYRRTGLVNLLITSN